MVLVRVVTGVKMEIIIMYVVLLLGITASVQRGAARGPRGEGQGSIRFHTVQGVALIEDLCACNQKPESSLYDV